MAAFSRLAAVYVGLVNLVALAGLDNPRVWKGGVALGDALPPVLGVVVAGLATSEIVLRWYRSSALAEKFSDRYGIMMFAMFLGGAPMGGLLAIILALSGMFGGESPIEPEQIPWVLLMALWIGFFGALYGGALGWIEGLILGVPLAAILGLFRNRGESNLSR